MLKSRCLPPTNVYWDRIVKVESLGKQDVFDGTVPGTHNFVADGLLMHNSLEQDADMVIELAAPTPSNVMTRALVKLTSSSVGTVTARRRRLPLRTSCI